MYNDDDFKDEEEVEGNQSKNILLDFYEANKKLIWILGGIIIFILIASLFMGGGNNTPVTPVEPDLVISSYNEKLSINNSTQLYAKVEDDTEAVFNWVSSNPDVATVNSNGVVTGVNYGTTIITVTYTRNGKSYSEKCEVIVAEGNPNVEIKEVSFQNGEVMISAGDTFKLPVIVNPSDGYMKSITFTSYNKDIVSVSEDGMIKALKVGKATVKVIVNNEFTSEINIHVLDKKVLAQIVVNPTKLDFLDNLLKIEVGESTELKYDFQPFDTTLSSLVWKSSDESVAKVVNGVVTGLKVGNVEIMVESLNGDVNDTMSLEVIPETVSVEGVQILSETSITLNVGGASNIVANVTPADATNKALIYKSSNTNVVTVDNDGNIKAIGAGNATITVSSVDGGKTASVNVVVNSNGSGGTSGGSGGTTGGSSGSSSIGKLKYRDKNELPAYTNISTALSKEHVGPITVSVNTGIIDRITLCVKKCVDNNCEDRTCTEQEVSLPYTINFTEGNGLYVIRSTKYRGNASEATQANFVNITNGDEACWLVGGEYKWTTESEALKEDNGAYKLTSYKTQGECEGTTQTSNDLSGTIKNLAGPTILANLVNDEVVVSSSKKMSYLYYCFSEGSCTIDRHTTNSAKTSYSLAAGRTCYEGSLNKTYIIKFSTTGTTFTHCVTGTEGKYINYIAEYTDGTISNTLKLQLK